MKQKTETIKSVKGVLFRLNADRPEVLVLTKRGGKYKDSTRFDDLPGGRWEPGETIEQTFTREAGQEVPGSEIKVLAWLPETAHAAGKTAMRILHIGIGTIRVGDSGIMLDKEHGEHIGYGFIPLDDACRLSGMSERLREGINSASELIAALAAVAVKQAASEPVQDPVLV